MASLKKSNLPASLLGPVSLLLIYIYGAGGGSSTLNAARWLLRLSKKDGFASRQVWYWTIAEDPSKYWKYIEVLVFGSPDRPH